ncbi:MAG TPA: gamma-glutamyltransferase family protein [Acidimicrobiia bacterium]
MPGEEPPEARRFPAAAVATPHHLATSTGLEVLGKGGNAVDAAVAAALTLAVVAPYTSGPGGDCFALVWAGAGVHAYNGSGRAPAAASLDAVRGRAGEAMPERGPLTVTVPGAVDAWFALLERFGTMRFEEVAARARGYATAGFPLSAQGAARIAAGAPAATGQVGEWEAVYGKAAAGQRLVQPGLARTLEALSAQGPDALYRGELGAAMAACVASAGGLLTASDLDTHRGDWVTPLSSSYRGVEVVELPPNSQGTTAHFALNLVEAAGSAPTDPIERMHLLIEAVKLALVERDAHLTDPVHMSVGPAYLADPARARERVSELRPHAAQPPTGHGGAGGTAAVVAVDPGGDAVSLLGSNYMGFGSGITVPGWGINLHNRGAYFRLDPNHVNVVAPAKRTLHTLMPAIVLRDGRPWCVLGVMGGDGQAQTHVQLLSRLVDDGEDLQVAVSAPRFLVEVNGWHLHLEGRLPPAIVDGLLRRGHDARPASRWDQRMGHAQAIVVGDAGLAGASDPRAEGLVSGL